MKFRERPPPKTFGRGGGVARISFEHHKNKNTSDSITEYGNDV